jgi:hypothetical protein
LFLFLFSVPLDARLELLRETSSLPFQVAPIEVEVILVAGQSDVSMTNRDVPIGLMHCIDRRNRTPIGHEVPEVAFGRAL